MRAIEKIITEDDGERLQNVLQNLSQKIVS
jgi:hypothetical protein